MASDDMNVGDDVRKAIAEGRRVQEAVRDITLKALTRHELDQRALRKVTRDAMHAVRESAAVQGASVTQAVNDAVGGVDQALAHAVQALKLSIDEAASHAGKFTHEDLARARSDLADLEKMPWRMLWGKSDFAVERYPMVTLKVLLFTLSSDRAAVTL